MANVRISDLTAVTSSVTTDELEVNQSGTSKKATLAQLLAAAGSSSVTIASAATTLSIGASTGTTTINNALVNLASHEITGNGAVIKAITAGTSQKFLWLQSTGADVYFGIESSSAGGFFTGSSAYASVIYSSTNVEIIIGAALQAVFSSSAGANRIVSGVRIGADSTNNLLDDASNGGGTATLYIGNASINVTSDERVKSNIRPLDDGLSIINALLPIEFDQDEERPFGDVRHYMGFGARHSHKVAPWAVNTQGDTGLPWKMRQEFLMAPVVRAMQQMYERIQKLEERIN